MPKTKPITFYGAAAGLWKKLREWSKSGWNPEQESNVFLIEGPAGTGKTFAILMAFHWIAETYPGVTLTFTRKIEADVNKRFLPDFEREVLGPSHPARTDGRTVDRRKFYQYPNGSRINIMGLDDRERWRSYQTDAVYVNEATQIDRRDFEVMSTRVRLWTPGIPFQLVVLDTNPGAPRHFLNTIADKPHPTHKYPQMQRLISRHRDNPKFFDHEAQEWTAEGRAYVDTALSTLTGIDRLRLKDGVWAAAEGLVYPEFRDQTHIINALPLGVNGKPAYKWFFGSVDWGFRDPGVIQVWGVTDDERMTLIHEVYRTGEDVRWWAAKAKALMRDMGVLLYVVPHDRPDNAKVFRDSGVPVRNNRCRAVETGLGLVRARLATDHTGAPRISFYRYALEQTDEALTASSKSTSTVDEFPSYQWLEDKNGRVLKEMPDPFADDHGMDAMRYAVAFVDKVRDIGEDKADQYPAGSLAARYNGNMPGLRPRS